MAPDLSRWSFHGRQKVREARGPESSWLPGRGVSSEAAHKHPIYSEGLDVSGDLATILDDSREDELVGAGFAVVGRQISDVF